MKIGAVGFGNRIAHVFYELKQINKALAEVINNDKITSLLEINLFYIIRVYSDIQTQIK